MRARSLSLRRRLTWYVVVTLLVLSAASGVAVYQGTEHEANELFSAALMQTARILDGLISRESIESNRQQLGTALERSPGHHEYERNLFFAVFDADGKLLLHSLRAPDLDADSVETGFSEFSYQDKKWFTFALQSSRDDLLIVVGERSGTREEITEYIGGGLLLPLILLLPLVLWALWQIVGVALRPLEDVAEQVRRQNIRQLKTIDVDGVPLEIDPLVEALNHMIEDLDRAYARERRFVSDASHELRNPLASLLINVDNAIEESPNGEAREALESMKSSIKRLSHLVSQLLALSHFENPQSGRTQQRVDLCGVCRRVAAAFETRAREADITIELQLPEEGCELRGDESLLLSLVSNLVDNAVKYGGHGARIRLRCARETGRVLLAVEDSGAGLDAEQRGKVMQRFYRAADTNIAGAGLGLSIVKTIADIYGATVELEESEFGGLAVWVRFEID